MTLTGTMMAIGIALTLVGLGGLGYCIARALGVRREADAEKAAEAMRPLVAVNMASVGIAIFGLMLVIVSLVL